MRRAAPVDATRRNPAERLGGTGSMPREVPAGNASPTVTRLRPLFVSLKIRENRIRHKMRPHQIQSRRCRDPCNLRHHGTRSPPSGQAGARWIR